MITQSDIDIYNMAAHHDIMDTSRKRKVLIRQGSKYLDGKLVGADYELEVSESFAEKYVGILSKAIKTSGETGDLAITDETRIYDKTNELLPDTLKEPKLNVQNDSFETSKGVVYFRIFITLITITLISVGWKWVHLYQKAIAKQQSTLSRMFDSCQRKSWYSTISSILFWEDEAVKCKEYFIALYANPLFEVSPIEACTEVISMIILRPFQLFGESLGIFYQAFLDPLSFIWKINGSILLFLSFIFLLIFIFGLRNVRLLK